MSVTSSSRGRPGTRETSPERTKVWTEPKPKTPRKVSVVYYLSRNGHLEHPHFMEVPLSSPHGLYLKDVIIRLNLLRGKGMATMYSWSSKRSYKNCFVWHDLTESDFIYPTQGHDYILKGSEILEHETTARAPLEEESDSPVVITRRRNQSWSSIDLNEYRVYKSEPLGENIAADASTQTEEKRRRRRVLREEDEEQEEEEKEKNDEIENEGETENQNQSTELSREEISPPPSDSSPETLGTLMKVDGRLGLRSVPKENPTVESCPSGRMRASSVLLQLLSCGAVSFKEGSGASSGKDQRFSLVGHYKSRLPRGGGNHVGKEVGTLVEIPDLNRVRLEDKEYFSGSLIETKKVEAPPFKRSSSYNADSSSRLQIMEHEGDMVRAKCIPRKSKTLPAKKEEGTSSSMDSVSRSQHGSKRFEGQQ